MDHVGASRRLKLSPPVTSQLPRCVQPRAQTNVQKCVGNPSRPSLAGPLLLKTPPMTTSPTPVAPVLSMRRPTAANGAITQHTRIDAVTMMGRGTREDGFVVARIDGRQLVPGVVMVQSVTQGFIVEMVPECTRHGDSLLVGLYVYRFDAAAPDECEIRFRAGASSAEAWVSTNPSRVAMGAR